MPIYNLKLQNRYSVAANTEAFEFTKPPGFQFTAGQYGGFTLMQPTHVDERGATRRFSFMSAPSDDHLAIVTRLQTSAYKQSLNALPIGSDIKFAGPSGNFILHPELEIPAALIAGGIGIAPFYSMLRDEWQRQSTREIYLFYGNRSAADSAFMDELIAGAHAHKNFHLISVMEQAEENWQGERGYITNDIIRRHIADIMSPIYYVCGAPKMVTVLQETVFEMGIPTDRVKVEDFPGY